MRGGNGGGRESGLEGGGGLCSKGRKGDMTRRGGREGGGGRRRKGR